MSSSSGAASGNFVTQQQPGQWLASRLIGTTVVSANNESIGDVNDVLMDRNGQSVAVVIGVGGFLGIGEKNVAVPFNQLEFTSRATGGGTASSATGTASGGTATSGSTASGNTATTGSTTAPGGTASTSASSSSDAPERIMLRMSKQDLQNAPQFARAGATGSGSGSSTGTGGGAGSTGGSGTAPRQ